MSRISPGTILLAFMAILCGLLGMFFSMRPKASPLAKAKKPQQNTVPVASTDLDPGRRITLGDIALMKLTREQMKQRGVTGVFMANPQQIIGRVLKQPLQMGKPFRTTEMFPEGVGPGIENSLRQGFRATTVAVGGNDALLGFATAGSWVDVIFRSGAGDDDYYSNDARYRNGRWGPGRGRRDRRGGAGDRDVTLTLLERVRVLAVDTNTLKNAPDKAIRSDVQENVSVTLEVTADQAEKLRVVDGRGQLSLALRAEDDMDTQDNPKQRTLDEILDYKDVVREMEVYQGTRYERITFERGGEDWKAYRSRHAQADPASPQSAEVTKEQVAAEEDASSRN